MKSYDDIYVALFLWKVSIYLKKKDKFILFPYIPG